MKYVCIIAFVLLLSSVAGAQYIFTNLQKKDGLGANEVYCSFKDNEGFMWFGTSKGLSRYDGAHFRNYTQINKNTPTAEDLIIGWITGKNNRQMWIGTSKGLYVFDKLTEIYTAVPIIGASKTVLSKVPVVYIHTDHHRRHWLETDAGVYYIKNDTAWSINTLCPATKIFDSISLTAYAVRSDSVHDGLWISTSKGLQFLNFKTRDIWSYAHNPERRLLFDTNVIATMSVDKKGNLWFCSSAHPLGYYMYDENKIVEKSTREIKQQYGIFIDSKERIWLKNFSSKIYVIEPDGKFVVLPDASPPSYASCNYFFNSIFEDDEQNLWIAGQNGISKLAADNCIENIISLPGNSFNEEKKEFLVNDMLQADSNHLWICKDDGLYLFGTQDHEVKRYGLSREKLQPNRIFDIQLIEGEWWCATGNGIQIFNPKTTKFRPFNHYAKDYDVSKISCIWIHQDREGMIWFSCWSNAVYRFNPQTKITTRVEEVRSTPLSASVLTNSLFAYESSDGNLWIGNGEKGIVRYNISSKSFHPCSLSGDVVVNHIFQDKDKRYWLSTTGRGILTLDKEGKLTDSITVNDGLISSHIFKTDIDNKGRMWASSNEGIQYINMKTRSSSQLYVDMGAPVHDLKGAMFLLGNKLYATTINKLAVINTDAVDKLFKPSLPVIAGVSIFEKNIPYSSTHPFLNLKYDQNFFSIEFSALHHQEIASLQYAYKLEGFNKDWVYCGRRQIASYTNVPDGHYTFLVKCTDGSGQWIDKSTSIDIRIAPPFWKTVWFIGILLIVVALIIGYAFKLNRKKKRKQAIEKTIDYFANSVYGENSVNEICWDIARNCISQLGFEDCVVYLYDEEKKRLVQKAAYGPKNYKGHEIENPIEIEPGQGIVGTVAITGKTLLVSDTSKDDRYIIDDKRRYSEMAVPIIHNNKVIGVIDSENSAKDYFTSGHVKALNTIAAISANKIAEATAEALSKQNEMKMLEINKLLAESHLMALRAQMNPHFVFNCLNSIQECIVTEKYGEASKYLNKFSKLFRTVLNNSGRKMVSLEEEKNVIELYLELEMMRFENSFEYSFIIDPDLDENEILIPSMLIQPYVENALWHGLMHKEGKRELRIEFKLLSEDVFECIIEDNGIGRKKSFELKAEQSKTKRHESKGLAISKDRLDVLQKQGYHTSFQMIDKYDEAGHATGTQIRIELSTELMN